METVATSDVADRAHRFDAVRRYLERNGVDYEVSPHPDTETAFAEARAYGAPPDRMVKTVALKTESGYVTVALPASEQLDVPRVRHLLQDKSARLATERELAAAFPQLDIGALPPFGDDVPPLQLVDRRILARNWVLANGGDHRHSLRVSPLSIIHLSRARVVDISQP